MQEDYLKGFQFRCQGSSRSGDRDGGASGRTAHDIVLAVSRSGSVSDVIVSNLKNYNEQINIIKNISAADNTMQQVFANKGFGSNDAKKIVLW